MMQASAPRLYPTPNAALEWPLFHGTGRSATSAAQKPDIRLLQPSIPQSRMLAYFFSVALKSSAAEFMQ